MRLETIVLLSTGPARTTIHPYQRKNKSDFHLKDTATIKASTSRMRIWKQIRWREELWLIDLKQLICLSNRELTSQTEKFKLLIMSPKKSRRRLCTGSLLQATAANNLKESPVQCLKFMRMFRKLSLLSITSNNNNHKWCKAVLDHNNL